MYVDFEFLIMISQKCKHQIAQTHAPWSNVENSVPSGKEREGADSVEQGHASRRRCIEAF